MHQPIHPSNKLTCKVTQFCVCGAGQGFLQLWIQRELFFCVRLHRLLLGDEYFPWREESEKYDVTLYYIATYLETFLYLRNTYYID